MSKHTLNHKKIINFYNTDELYLVKITSRKQNEYRAILSIIETHFNNNRSIKILDVGCGPGLLLKILSLKGYNNLEGIDLSKRFIQYAQNINHIRVNHADFLKYNFKKKYDCIICSDFLEHALNPNNIVKKIHQLLNFNGLLIIQGPNLLPLISLKTRITGKKLKLFVNKLILKLFHRSQTEIYMKPQLNQETYMIDDADAIYLINPFDMVYFLTQNNFDIGIVSTFYNPMNNYTNIKKIIVRFLDAIPFINYMGGTLIIAAANRKISCKEAQNLKRVISESF